MVVQVARNRAVNHLVAVEVLFDAAFDYNYIRSGKVLYKRQRLVESRCMTLTANHKDKSILAGAWTHERAFLSRRGRASRRKEEVYSLGTEIAFFAGGESPVPSGVSCHLWITSRSPVPGARRDFSDRGSGQ